MSAIEKIVKFLEENEFRYGIYASRDKRCRSINIHFDCGNSRYSMNYYDYIGYNGLPATVRIELQKDDENVVITFTSLAELFNHFEKK